MTFDPPKAWNYCVRREEPGNEIFILVLSCTKLERLPPPLLHPVVYPVENFAISSSSETTLSFSWTQSRIVADNLTGYILTCSSLLEGTTSPDPIMTAPTSTTAKVTELFSGVTYSCEIITLTSEGRSQPRTVNSTTVETG